MKNAPMKLIRPMKHGDGHCGADFIFIAIFFASFLLVQSYAKNIGITSAISSGNLEELYIIWQPQYIIVNNDPDLDQIFTL